MEHSPAERLAAFLVAPDVVSPPAPSELPGADAFADFVEAHHLPLEEAIAVNQLADHEVVASESVQRALEADRQRHRENLELFDIFREAFREAGIPHVFAKGMYQFPYRSINVDYLIPEKDVPRADRILTDLGFIYNRYRPGHFKRLHVVTSGSRWVGTLHLHTAVGWYSVFIEPDVIFEGAVEGGEPGVRVPRREVAMAITGTHALYEDATVRLIEMHKIRYLMRSGPVDWDWLWAFAVRRGFESGLALVFLILDRQHRRLTGQPLFEENQIGRMEGYLSRVDGTRRHYRKHVAGRDLPALYIMSKYFVRRCLFRQLWRSRLMSPGHKIKTACRILKGGVHQVTRWWPQPAFLMAVCGPDGCGKTTQIEWVAEALEVYEIRSRRSWIRIGDSFLLNWFKKPFHRRVRAEVDTGGRMTSEQGVFRSRFLRTVWALAAVSDYLLRQYAVYIWTVLHERMIIADRYHVDALVDLALRCGPEVMRKHWVLTAMRMLPKARAAFVLKVSDETMRRRRAEDYVEGVTHRVIEYYDEAARLMDVPVLDGDQEPEALAETIVKATLPRFFERA